MTNRFDFELVADDKVSAALEEINDRINELQPGLDKTRDKLNMGGQETHDGLSNINRAFQMLGRFAKDNVQFIGDMVPPLRNFTGIAGRMGGLAGKLGLAGGAAYLAGKGIAHMAGDLNDAATNAYGLQVAAENAGMGVKDFTQLSGAMRLLGSDSEAAQNSVEGLYKTFNDALQGRNNAALAVMNQIHAPIIRNADGTANVLETAKKLAEVFYKLKPQNQKTVADALGLDADGLQLLREGAHLKELLTKSDAVGLTVDPKINRQLAEFNRATTEASAAWDGFKQRLEQRIASKFLSGGSVTSGIKGITDVLEHGIDPISVGHVLNFNVGNDADMMRRAKQDKAFLATLNPWEKNRLDAGIMTEADRGKYRLRYGLGDQASALQDDMKSITQPAAQNSQAPAPTGVTNPNALSVINNNPWNIRYAGQANAMPGAGNFARFSSPNAGVEGADHQLQLYYTGESRNVDHPLRTLSEIIRTASPEKDGNNTPLMIQDASRELGVDPNQQLDLSDVGMRSRVLAALFNREGNNPYTASQIQSILQQKQAASPAPLQVANQVPLPASPTPLTPAPAQPSIMTPVRPPAAIAPEPSAAASPATLASALSTALKEQGMKIELTLIDAKSGQRQTYTGSGSKVSTAMQFP